MDYNAEDGDKGILFDASKENDYGSTDAANSFNGSLSSGEYTFEEAVEHFGFGKFQIRLGISVGLTLVADAAQLLAPAVLGSVLECSSWHLSKVEVAWLTTIVFLGMIAFSSAVGWIIDKFGRKKGILVTLTAGAVFAALGAVAPSYPYLLASRFFVGAALAGSLQVFGYIEEFLPVGHRRRAMLTQLFWPLGGLWASGFGLLMIHYLKLSWQWYLVVLSVPLFLTVLFVVLLPESARFLGALGKFDKVHKILTKIGKENGTGLPRGNLSTVSLCSYSESDKPAPKAAFAELFSGQNLKTTLFLAILWFASGFCYYGMVLLVTTFDSKDKTSKSNCIPLELGDYYDLIWTGFAEIPGTIIVFYALEKFGRKKSLIVQFIIAGASFIPFYFRMPYGVYLASLLIGRATAQGIISALVIYTPEVYPTFLRGKGIGLANMFFRTGGMATPFFSQVTVHNYFDLTISFYAGFCFLAAICAFLLPKETQGLELED
ncbi:synaptic vesicle 2-related protein-like [Rhopilema esculentum]|uniref:synaptic vesicle 2-related protein-like n=1 Tax=Rhopilema esculentum TaxID=499914 RepID=UPI0031D1A0EF